MIYYRIEAFRLLLVYSFIISPIFGEDSFALPASFALGSNSEVAEYDLLGAVEVPFVDSKTQYIDEDGHDGFPAFGFKAGSDVKLAHRVILPDKLPANFSILVSAKPRSRKGGFLFAVINPYETVVTLGVKIAPEGAASTAISLYYTDAAQITSQILANFTVSRFNGKWTRFSFRLAGDNLTLFFNCNETETVGVKREPLELVFDSASTLYIAQAGPVIGEFYEGALDQLKIYPDENMAANQCKTDFQGFQAINQEFENEIIDDVERTDYDTTFREGSGDDFAFLPPPPPPPNAGYGRGEKGERGPRGPPGEPIRGPPGPPGPPGPTAATSEGQCACNLTSIIATLSKSSASAGYGREGAPGARGPPGERGPQGPKGEIGERGAQGLIGPQGPRGEQGLDGGLGKQGPPGPPGPPGPVEFENVDETVLGSPLARPGVPGTKGEPGKPGPSGPRGDKGPLGAKGAAGEPGAKGEHGDRGLPGPQGGRGEPGVDGLPGGRGEPGAPGLALAAGELTGVVQGAPGPKGERGADGEAGIPGVGGPAGPRGERGQRGEDGAIGPVGPPGVKGDRGERGPPGSIITPNGNEEIITVKGDKGDMGKRGRRGKIGPPGPPGKGGNMGEMGLPGWMGRPGSTGLPGFLGAKGEKGDSSGPKGEKGDRGPEGAPGRDGRDGSPGAPGLPGATSSDENVRYIPVPGPPGPPGPAGMPGLSIAGPKGEPGSQPYGEPTYNLRPGRATASPPVFAAEQEVGARIVPGAVTFQDRDAMTKMSTASPVGTLAYVVEEEALLVRVNNGWQYIALGSLLPVTTPAPPTTSSPQLRPPFEASNLINQITKPADVSNWYPKMLRMAALNEPHTGDVHGVRGADYTCYREARRAGLRGTFRALLSSRVQNVDSIVRQADRRLPVANLRGEVLFNSWFDMFKGDGAPFPHPPRVYSFSGKNVLADMAWPHKAAWHGALASGERALDTSCDAWHSGARDKVGLAGSLRGPKLLEQTEYSCDKKLVLLCIEATSELFVQRRKRGLDESYDDLLTEEDYHNLLNILI